MKGRTSARRKTPRRESAVVAARAGEYERAEAAAKFLRARSPLRPRIGLVLGSGLGAFADRFTNAMRVPYSKIPNFPHSTTVGHAGQLVIGRADGIPFAAMQGRVHLYEGCTAKDAAFPMRVFARMGVRAVILTNAAGGIRKDLSQGRLVTISDHINLQGVNPLTGPNDERFGPRFPDMSATYDREFREFAAQECRRLGIEACEGVYAALAGPSYETPAEIRYLRAIGADLVGMSTVPEVLAARHCGMRVLGISCVTNAAAGILDQPLDHAEVLATGARVKGQFIALLEAVLRRIHGAIS